MLPPSRAFRCYGGKNPDNWTATRPADRPHFIIGDKNDPPPTPATLWGGGHSDDEWIEGTDIFFER